MGKVRLEFNRDVRRAVANIDRNAVDAGAQTAGMVHLHRHRLIQRPPMPGGGAQRCQRKLGALEHDSGFFVRPGAPVDGDVNAIDQTAGQASVVRITHLHLEPGDGLAVGGVAEAGVLDDVSVEHDCSLGIRCLKARSPAVAATQE